MQIKNDQTSRPPCSASILDYCGYQAEDVGVDEDEDAWDEKQTEADLIRCRKGRN